MQCQDAPKPHQPFQTSKYAQESFSTQESFSPICLCLPQKRPRCSLWKQLKHGFEDISRVKQHLRRCHLTHICERCGSQFAQQDDLTGHHRQRESCNLIAKEDQEEPLGITSQQLILLNRRCDAKMDKKEQWAAVWRIVFPHYRGPKPSPYVDGCEKVDAVFQFAYAKGPSIAKNIPGLSHVPPAAIETLMEKIRDEFKASRQLANTPQPTVSPGSDDSPLREAPQEPVRQEVEEHQPVPVNGPIAEEKNEGASVEDFSFDQLCTDTLDQRPYHMLNSPLNVEPLLSNADGWNDFEQYFDTSTLQ